MWNHSKENHFQKITEHDIKDTPSQLTCFRLLSLPYWECFIGSSTGKSCILQLNSIFFYNYFIVYSGAIYHAVQDGTTCTEVVRMDKAIQNIVSYEESLCVLTSGGVLSVFIKNKKKDSSKNIELLNTVLPEAFLFRKGRIHSFSCLIPTGENKWEITLDSTDVVK